MRVIAYTYEAAFHCVACAVARFGASTERFETGDTSGLDEHGIPYEATDGEGNKVHPVFSTDEVQNDECCDDCFERIRG